MPADSVVLDFENAEVRSSDYDSLRPSGWLTGEIINFYWTFLERREFPTHPSVLFLGTYTAYRISTAESSRDTELIARQLSSELGGHRRLILVPLNSRNHWSLLVYCRPTRTFYHYDSIASHNRVFAERAAGRFLRVVEPRAKEGFYFKSMQTPQQNNDFDCGVYVLAIAEELARRFVNHVERKGKEVYERLNEARDFATDGEARSRTFSHASQGMPLHQHQGSRHASASAAAAAAAVAESASEHAKHSPHNTLPNRALASHLLMPRFAQPQHQHQHQHQHHHHHQQSSAFAGFHSPFEHFYRSPAGDSFTRQRLPEPLLKGGGQHSADCSAEAHSTLRRTLREERLKLEVDMMEKAGLPRDFWLVTVEDIEYPQCMRRRIRALVVELRRQQKQQQM